MINGEQIEFQKAGPSAGALRSSTGVNGRVRINYKLNPCGTLRFRAQQRLFLEAHAETKYCLSSRQQDTLTTVQTQICACNNAQQKKEANAQIVKLCRENVNLSVQQK